MYDGRADHAERCNANQRVDRRAAASRLRENESKTGDNNHNAATGLAAQLYDAGASSDK